MDQPNILFIFADQLRYSALACNGNTTVRTPALDRLACEGVTLDNAFSGCPICSPYRGQLLTGRYSHVNGVVCNEYGLFDDQPLLAQVLKDNGYRTAYIGKWHLGYGPYGPEDRYGFDHMYAYNCCHHYYDVSYWHNEEGPFKMADYAPRCETQLTLDFVREHLARKDGAPFAAVVSWGPPHWTHGGAARNRDSYGVYPQKYDLYDPAAIDVLGNVPEPYRLFARNEKVDYYAMVTSLDDQMGEIMEALEQLGIAENTIVCFSSDHGDHLWAHGFGKPYDQWLHHTLQGCKGTPFEESIHIPFILRWPGKVAGDRRTDSLFNSVDVMPTLLSLCGIDIPDSVQGTDLSHAVLGGEGGSPDSVYLQIMGPGTPQRAKWLGLWRGLRTKHYTYARWADRGGQRMLFDHTVDPLEMNNVVDHPQYADVAATMEARLKQWIADAGDPFDTGERLPVTEMLDVGQWVTSENVRSRSPREYIDALRTGGHKP
jgi:arylsulfatase A-like enzyme